MKVLRSVLAVSLIALSVSGGAMAQTHSGAYMTGDHNMRASKIVDLPVYNLQHQQIGTIDDILLPANGGEVTATLSVGGYLGEGAKMVKVPLSHVQFAGETAMMAADKTMLRAMPDYSYAQMGGGG